MTVKTKVFVALAIIGALGYTVDLILTLVNGTVQPSAFKIILILAFAYYAVKKIKEARLKNK